MKKIFLLLVFLIAATAYAEPRGAAPHPHPAAVTMPRGFPPMFVSTYYVATDGNDSNLGTVGSPWLTLQHAANTMICGDTTIVAAGSYDGKTEVSHKVGSTTDLCSSWGSPIIMKAMVAGTVTLTASGSDAIIGVEGNNNGSGAGTNCGPDENICWTFVDIYWQFENFTLDGTTMASDSTGLNIFFASHAKFLNFDISHAANEGVNARADNGWHCSTIDCVGSTRQYIGAYDRAPQDIWFVGGRVHHNGRVQLTHGMYLSSATTVVDGVEIDHNPGIGVQFTNSGSFVLNDNIARNNLIHDNCCGLIGSNGHRQQFYNNVVYGHSQFGIGIGASTTPQDAKVFNNTVDGSIVTGGTRTLVEGNIVTGTVDDYGAGNTYIGNFTATSADFTNSAIRDYTLASTSAARGYAPNLTASFSTDRLGNARPAVGNWDAGAYVYAGTPCVSDHLNFYSQPSNALIGASLGTVSVEILTSGNVRCTTATDLITLSKQGSATWGTLASASSLAVSATAGLATWTDLSVTTSAGSGMVVASASGLSNVNSSSITISSPGCTPHHLSFTSQPSSALLGASAGTATVNVYNASNQVCANATNTITFSKHSGSCTGMTIGGTQTGAAVAGVFSSGDLNLTARTGSCSFDAASSGLTGATSNTITVSEVENLSAGFLVIAASAPPVLSPGGGALGRLRIRIR